MLGSRKVTLLSIVALIGLFDLFVAFQKAGVLFKYQIHPGKVYQIDTRARQLAFSQRRLPYPRYSKNTFGRQSVRYPSLLQRKPFAVSPVILFKGEDQQDRPDSLKHALEVPRWNSFLLLKSYFELIHSKTPTSVLEDFFSLKKEVFYMPQNGFQYRLASYDTDRLHLKLFAPKDGPLFWSDGYDPHWKAQLNGRKIAIHQVFKNFKALSLPKGVHDLMLTYDPILMKLSLYIFYAIATTGIGLLLWHLFTPPAIRYHKPTA